MRLHMKKKINSYPFIINLNGNWEFSYTRDFELEKKPNFFPVLMSVPGYWDDSIDFLQAMSFFPSAQFNPDYKPNPEFPFFSECPDTSLPYLSGTGWYRKVFVVRKADINSRFILDVGPVRMEAYIWINDSMVKHHQGHSTGFRIDITDFVKIDQDNEIVVAITNTRTDRLGCDIRGYKGKSGGIVGKIKVEITGSQGIEELYVYRQSEEKMFWQVALTGKKPKKINLDWKIKSIDGYEILGQGSLMLTGVSGSWKTGLCGMKPWSDRDPVLYRLCVILRKNDSILDQKEQLFGLRSIEVDGTGLKLNGLPLFLRGATEHCYFPETCTPPLAKEYYVDRLMKWKSLGFNWLRFHTWVPGEAYLQAADELGMLIQVEPPKGYCMEEWEQILRCCRKHPSVIIYCCGNEEILDNDKIDELEQCQKLLREIVPDSLFNPQEALRGIEYSWNKSDFGLEENIEEIPFLHNRQRLERLKEFSDVLGSYPQGLLSYGSTYASPSKLDRLMKIYEKPLLSHELGILGTYADLSLEARCEGTRIGSQLYSKLRKYLDEVGLAEKADIFYKNSCRQMQSLRKDLFETARLSKFLAGYDFLGPNDNHWHRTG